ncbi:alpha/beta fold hydrolase [Flavobacterium hauense]
MKTGVIDINGQNIYVESIKTSEERPTIVFLHDSLGCVALWRDFTKKVAEATGCNVMVYDRIGYGKSDPMNTHIRKPDYLELEADTLNDLLVAMQLENVVLFGHSDGGSIALITAAKYPSYITAVICEAAHVFVEDVTLNGIVEAMHAYETTDLQVRLQKYHGDKVDTLFKAWTQTWTGSEFRQWNIEHFLKDISSPLLFIQGEKDEYGTLQQVDKTIDQVGGETKKCILSGVGHTPHKEAPEETLHAIVEFLKQFF